MTWTDTAVAFASIATAAGTVALAIAAFIAWRTAKKALEASKDAAIASQDAAKASQDAAVQARRSVEVMEDDSRLRRLDSARASRPYVLVRMAPSLTGNGAWDLVVENLGVSAAYDVRLDIDGHLLNDPDVLAHGIQKFADSGMMLPPGGRVRTIWYLPPDRFADPKHGNGYEWANVTTKYSDGDGTVYDDDPAVVLNADTLGHTPIAQTGTVAKGPGKNVREVIGALRAIASNLGEVAR